MMRISVDLTGARKKLALGRRAIEPRAILKVITLRLVAYIAESFETRGRGSWQPLTKGTIALRRQGGDAPLQDTGEYRKSWTGQAGGGDPAAKTDDKTYVSVGTAMMPLAEWQEHGTKPFMIRTTKRTLAARLRGGGFMVFGREVQNPGIPARPVLPDPQDARRMLQEVVNAMVEQVLSGNTAEPNI